MRNWLVIVLFCLLAAAPSRAVVYRVDSVNDAPDASIDGTCATAQGECTLRAAVMEANLGPSPGKSEIVIQVPAGEYTLTVPAADATPFVPAVAPLELTRDVRILGAGAGLTKIHPSGHPAFHVNAGASVRLVGLSVTGGGAVNTVSVIAEGGAVINEGTLSILECSFLSNSAGFYCALPNDDGTCGAYNVGVGGAVSSSGSLDIERSYFSGNFVGRSGSGGAIYSTGPLIVRGSVLEGNEATSCGHHICAEAPTTIEDTTFSDAHGLFEVAYALEVVASVPGNTPSLSMTNVTIWGNDNVDNLPVPGGGLHLDGAAASLNNVTIARNSPDGIAVTSSTLTIRNSVIATDGVSDITCSGSLIDSNGYNIVERIAGTCGIAGAYTSLDPLLGPLQYNGGPPLVLTALPGPGSPAINAGDPAGCRDALGNLLASDQRGVKRPIGPRCDLGAVEANPNGDANDDGTVGIADVFYLLNFLFAGGPAPLGSADVNQDGTLDVADVFYLIDYLFAGGPAPL
jgi:Dockerin type I domain